MQSTPQAPQGIISYVIELKGTDQVALLKNEEKAKIRCAKKHFKALNTDVTEVQASSFAGFVDKNVYEE